MDFDRKETPSDSVPADIPQRRILDMVTAASDCKASRILAIQQHQLGMRWAKNGCQQFGR